MIRCHDRTIYLYIFVYKYICIVGGDSMCVSDDNIYVYVYIQSGRDIEEVV